MVAYFCNQLSDKYVDLSDLYVDFSDIRSTCQINLLLIGQEHVFKDLFFKMNKWQVNIKIWQVNIKIGQDNIIIWQVMEIYAAICWGQVLQLFA